MAVFREIGVDPPLGFVCTARRRHFVDKTEVFDPSGDDLGTEIVGFGGSESQLRRQL